MDRTKLLQVKIQVGEAKDFLVRASEFSPHCARCSDERFYHAVKETIALLDRALKLLPEPQEPTVAPI